MAPTHQHAVATVMSTRALSHDESTVLVEAGSHAPMRWFLTHALSAEEDDEDPSEPPTKRRKVSADSSMRTQHIDEAQHIPVATIQVDLHFPETLNSRSARSREVLADVEFEGSESVEVIPSIIELSDGGKRIRLCLPRKHGPVLYVDIANLKSRVLDAFHAAFDSRLMHENKSKIGKTLSEPQDRRPTSVRCTLTPSTGQLFTIIRLEMNILWQSGVSAFPAGVPVGKARVYHDYNLLAAAYPDEEREGVDHSQPWTPQDFYASVHVPSKDQVTKEDFKTVLETELYPFQKRALHWLLGREGVRSEGCHIVTSSENAMRSDVHYFRPVADAQGQPCYVNHLQGIIQRNVPGLANTRLSGGILAEEMGLGKTVEVMALLSTHKRAEPLSKAYRDPVADIDVTPSGATLIVTPKFILQQWQSEILRHAPALKVLVYEGVKSKTAKSEKQTITELASNYDIVLVTYSTLTSEVHFAEDPPDRAMRHKPAFERRRSPLVSIQWWRICLDEAQMVESGVTAAARVARRLPRVHSWAVSGTPLRKDVQDLHGLLLFLGYHPICDDDKLWSHLITNHRHIFRKIFSSIAMRHTKAQIREDLHLPQQKRVIITMPFSAIEEQHYSELFKDMCREVGTGTDGSPQDGDWDPQDPLTTDAMRRWLVRLRQSCLHPQVGAKNRRALGRGSGPIRTVAEVLEVMIEQNELELRQDERALLNTQLLQGHVLGNNKEDEHRSEKAVEIYVKAMEDSAELVRDARARLAEAKQACIEDGATSSDTDDEDAEHNQVIGQLRNHLRTTLQLQHSCTFFAATAYYQTKSNIDITEPETERYTSLEEKETALYENAKVLRKEILLDAARKAESLMRKISDIADEGHFTPMPSIKELESFGGIEARRIVDKSDELFDKIREQGRLVSEWRARMAEYLVKPLVDKDDGMETTGDEYEDSTKFQDELYPYFDAVKALQADLTTSVTGEQAPLIDAEVKFAIKAAKTYLNPDIVDDMKQNVHAPELTLKLLAARNRLRGPADDSPVSIRSLIQEARGIEASLQGSQTGFRVAEGHFARKILNALQVVFKAYTKALAGLETEVDLFRRTQNQRLEFYRQLQELSDTVRPYKEELDLTLDTARLTQLHRKAEDETERVQNRRSRNKFLLTLRNHRGQLHDEKCLICLSEFMEGTLIVCGHCFCRPCMQMWAREHNKCPTCRRTYTKAELHNITYKPQELKGKEEAQTETMPLTGKSSSPNRQDSIYTTIDERLLHEMKAIDLPSSYGTKMDNLGRHLLWIREHDPGAKSIVFSQYREFLDVLGTALQSFKIGYARLGRNGAVEKFKKDPSIDCLLLDAKTDSSGMTLVNATHVFICEPLIQTAVELQAIARVHRIGQTRPTTVWMYLITDTVEEAIYEISVARRLAYVQARQSTRSQKSRSATPSALQENAIDAANSEQLQSAPISTLLVAGKGGGELVGNDDLWQCLFGKAKKETAHDSIESVPEVARHMRAEAAEQRAGASAI